MKTTQDDTIQMQVGPDFHLWYNPPWTELAGRQIIVKTMENSTFTWKLQRVVKRVGDVYYYCYVPMPADKEELKQCLLDIAEYEGIDLQT